MNLFKLKIGKISLSLTFIAIALLCFSQPSIALAEGEFETDLLAESIEIVEEVKPVDITNPGAGGGSVMCEKEIKIIANKIVCNDESLLPNFGDTREDGNPINQETVIDFLRDKGNNCWLEKGWYFQWALDGNDNPGDNTGEANLPWKTFGPTNLDGETFVSIPLENQGSKIWVREVFQKGFLPFSGLNGSNVSSEFYCHEDVFNYDNYEWIKDLKKGNNYHCVAFNALVPEKVLEKEIANDSLNFIDITPAEDEEDEENGGMGRSPGHGSEENQGEVLGEEISIEDLECGMYLNEYIKYGANNNPEEVKKLQIFLNDDMGANLPLTGFYGLETMEWVNKFQVKYKEQILRPWVEEGLHPDENIPTGYVYKTTKRQINLLHCPSLDLPTISLEEDKIILVNQSIVTGEVLGEETINEENKVENGENSEQNESDAKEELVEENTLINDKKKVSPIPAIILLLVFIYIIYYLIKRKNFVRLR